METKEEEFNELYNEIMEFVETMEVTEQENIFINEYIKETNLIF